MFGDIALDVLSVLGHLNLTLQVSFVCPFVVIDPADLGATAEFQALCLSIFNLSPDAENARKPFNQRQKGPDEGLRTR